MIVVEWYNESAGWDHAVVSSMGTANLLRLAFLTLCPNLTVVFKQVGNGYTGAEIK